MRYVLAQLALIATLSVAGSVSASEAQAHRAGCHTKHSCPSDHATYRWSAKRLLCVKPTSDERTRRFTIKVRYGGLVYWCRR